PGTHDAGAFDGELPPTAQNQTMNFEGQFMHGIRAFDLRILKTGDEPPGPISIWPPGWQPNTYYLHHSRYFIARTMALDPQLGAVGWLARGIELFTQTEMYNKELIFLVIAADIDNAEHRALRDHIRAVLAKGAGRDLVFDYGSYKTHRCTSGTTGVSY